MFKDLNCDLGEIPNSWYFGEDKELLKHITSVNVSCGAHAGTDELIQDTISLSIASGINIGAHPSFPDRSNFGRKFMAMNPSQLREELKKQITYLTEIIKSKNGKLHHIKPHGALYNFAASDDQTSRIICETILDNNPKLILFCPSNSVTESVARKLGIEVWREAFVDRAYDNYGKIIPRREKNALIEEPYLVFNQAINLTNGFVISNESKKVLIASETLCLHGDSKNALEIAKSIRKYSNN
jgi:UPF0271 protein